MKFMVILGDGMADYKLKELGDKTPLQYAQTPNLDHLARIGTMGLAKTVPSGMHPGSDIANLSVLGYDPHRYYTGRSPLEAVSLGIAMEPTDIAFRCNLVTLSDEVKFSDKTMVDYSSDEISTAESAVLIQAINQQLGTNKFVFYPGISYRHVLIWKDGLLDFDLTPPHDISERKITEYLPKGDQSKILLDLMVESNRLLAGHPINQERISNGHRPANSIWLWGQGKKPAFPAFKDQYGLNGSVVCAVDLIKGLGIGAGLKAVAVPGATGGTVTNMLGKAQAALEQLKQGQDFVYLHIEAPDEAGHRGELDTKIKAIEEIDAKVVGVILQGLEESRELPGMEDYCLLILPDHPTPISTRTHASDAVPFLIYRRSQPQENGAVRYNEDSAQLSGLRFEAGHQLMEYFINLGKR